MAKTSLICFRTSENLRSALEKISQTERRPLSSTIEYILYEYVEQREPKDVSGEKRRYPRRGVSVPALVTMAGAESGGVHAGIVKDVSLGGLKISLPRDLEERLQESPTMSIVFTLPETKRALTVECAPKHLSHTNGEINIGTAFVNTDFASCQNLQDYLLQ